jgi:hypothetical protein
MAGNLCGEKLTSEPLVGRDRFRVWYTSGTLSVIAFHDTLGFTYRRARRPLKVGAIITTKAHRPNNPNDLYRDGKISYRILREAGLDEVRQIGSAAGFKRQIPEDWWYVCITD